MEWIKVSDRLPDVNYSIDVLVTTLHNGTAYTETCIWNPHKRLFVMWNSYTEDDEPVDGVIAWMPFPEPFVE